ncbi:hypothetical protein [Nocardioides jiangxiensis]|uniref:Uncharacterized protein n=1 Tax=Nocardioides jiangxiensis TaxID=3064524 RepID=A0ABT9AWY0_9ACTN|nr:hypothetical protein [Nocardioides sp. WY-20]MDO7867011.1 hypothetical protein [Nocardioides sp. WY-20]
MLADAAAPTAGGSSFSDIALATGIAALFYLPTGWVIVRERLGHPTVLGRFSDVLGTRIGLPGWAAVPVLIMVPVWLVAAAVYWDVPLHLQKGRDPGALANPSHYPIFLALIFFNCLGLLVMALARDPLPRRTLRLAPGWHVPWSSVILTLSGFIAVVGFPLDDLWHRLFGQDVTEWGPTHVLMIGGAVTSIFSVPLMLAEAQQTGARLMNGPAGRWVMASFLSLSIVCSVFLMEFELGLPQFPAPTEFIIFGFVITWTAIGARLWFGPGGALVTLAWWWIMRGYLIGAAALIPDIMSIRSFSAVPATVTIEAVALAFGVRRGARSVVPFAATAAVVSGTLGLWLEFQWSKHVMTLPQPFDASGLPLYLTVGTLASLAGALVATWQVRRLVLVASDPRATAALPDMPRGRRWYGLTGFLALVALMAVFAPPGGAAPSRATVTWSDASNGEGECPATSERCLATLTLTLEDPSVVHDAAWFYALSWQGNRAGETDVPRDPVADVPGIVRARMLPTGEPGVYRSSVPLPVYGQWKTMVRLHTLPRTMMAWALYMPDDPAISSSRGRLVHAASGAVVSSHFEPELLQRERRDDVPTWLFDAGNGAVLCLWVLVLLGYGRCYNLAAAPLQGRRKPEPTAA